MTTYMEPLCDLRKSNKEKYVTITHRVAGETVREEHWIFGPGSHPYIARWDVRGYLPGRGRLQVGDRMKYTGKNHDKFMGKYVEDVPLGTMATVTKDYGWDSRYMFEFDAPTSFHHWSRYPDGEYQDRTCMRTSGYGWTQVNDEG